MAPAAPGLVDGSVMVDARAGDHLDVSAPHFLSLHLSPVAREGSPGYEEGRALDGELVDPVAGSAAAAAPCDRGPRRGAGAVRCPVR